jgi:hypothetical protein
MSTLEPQTRFLLRGTASLIGLLALWWFVLLGPMLYLLTSAAEGFMHIEETPAGDWTLGVALERTLPATARQGVPRQIHSIDFDIPRFDLITFTFSLPLYWAIMLAAPGLRRNRRALLLGTALMSAAEVALLLAFTQITARNAVAQLAGEHDIVDEWILAVASYLVVQVLPYILPFLFALLLHRELRGQVFLNRQVFGTDDEEAPNRLPVHGRRGQRRAQAAIRASASKLLQRNASARSN